MGSETVHMAVQRTYGTIVSVLRAKNIAWNAWPVPGRWSQYRIAVVMGVIVVMQVMTVMIIHGQSTRLITIYMGNDCTRSEHEARHDFKG